MVVVRWVAFALFLGVVAVLGQMGERGLVTVVLAAAAFVLFLAVCWTLGAFRRDTWIGDAPVDEPPSRLDVLDGRGRR